MATLEFFYDFVSPYSYLASTRVETVVARHRAEVRFRPFLLGGVFKATGNRSPIETVAKGRHMWVDLERWARRLEVPFRRPQAFPVSSLLALRAGYAAEERRALVPYTHAVFRAYWGEGRDIASPEVLAAVASEAGLDGAALAAAAPLHKADLAASTDEAVRRGAYGAPAFFVGDEMFIGNDRLDFVEDALARR
jgi:2-hydroxychromene-2-carboxylate isomerase